MAIGGETTPESERILRHEARIAVPVSGPISYFAPSIKSEKISDFSDIAISESVSPATFNQAYSSLAALSGGQYVLVWEDDRNGSRKIYGQLFDGDGNAVGTNRLLVGREDGFNVIEPKAVTDGSGGFYLAWRDESSGKIYAARYNSSMTRIVNPFVINDIPAANYAGPYDIDNYLDSRLAVVWEDYGVANDISLRIFSSSGTALRSVIKINRDSLPANHWAPSVAVNAGGGMAVVWEDYRHGNADIFMQLINADGSYSGPNLGVVEGAYDDSAQYMPRVAFSSRDGYAISWLDKRGKRQEVYVQRYIPGTGLSGTNIKISSNDSLTTSWDIAMDINSGGNLFLAWASVGLENKILLQKFTTDFALNGSIGTVSAYGTGSRWETVLKVGSSDKMICGWTDFRSGNGDIYAQLLSSSGSRLFANDKKVNDDTIGAQSTNPDLAVIDNGKVLVVFADERNDDGDIYVQLVNNDGTLAGGNTRVNGNDVGDLQSEPRIAVSAGRALAVWNDSRAIAGVTGSRIFGRFMTLDGIPDGEDFCISDSAVTAAKRNPAVAILSGNTAMVAWIDYRSGSAQIYARHYGNSGVATGPEFMVSSPATDLINDCLNLVTDPDGNFIISWLSRGYSGGPAVIVARYNTSGGLINRFVFQGGITGAEINDMAVAVPLGGDIFILWEGLSDQKNLYLAVLSGSGATVTPSFEVTEVASDYDLEPSLAVDNERFVVAAWIDSRSGKRRVYSQVFDYNLYPAGVNTPISSAVAEFAMTPDVAALNRTGWIAWSDPRSNGLNIYLSQMSYTTVDVDDNDNPGLLPAEFVLEQNYPNPFNPSTRIVFNVPTRNRVTITVYNILGQNLAVLTDRTYDAGRYEVTWDSRDERGNQVPSGIYFYKMSVGSQSFSKKMILIK
nr:T9SS type A sorting domain-containing protein [candidate division Zixibacteria bacterium]